MAEALMKYETIDVDQINDIMEGRTPRPPMDWSDDEPPAGGGAPAEDKPPEGGVIGGPAGQH
jgi:cell division protease FtsH